MSIPDHAASAPLANPSESEWLDRVWCLSFGAYGDTRVYVWADSLETAFEGAVEYLDDQGECGHFTYVGEAEYQEAAADLGREWDASAPDYDVVERAQTDLTSIGWTTLDCEREAEGKAFVPSWEWSGYAVRGEEKRVVEERAATQLEADEAEGAWA